MDTLTTIHTLELLDQFDEVDTEDLVRYAIEFEDQFRKVRKVISVRDNPLDKMPDLEFRVTFGFHKSSFRTLESIFSPNIPTEGLQASAIFPREKLYIFLHFMTTNASQNAVAKQPFVARSQTRVSRVINEVAKAISSRYSEFVTFPSPMEEQETVQRIQAVTGFPSARGVIGNTSIKVCRSASTAGAGSCVKGKGFFYINIFFLCDAYRKIRFFTANYPDAIRNESSLRDLQELHYHIDSTMDQMNPKFVLADENYLCTQTMITPYPEHMSQLTPQIVAFNRSHEAAFALADQTSRSLKLRFRRLSTGLYSDLANIPALLKSCIVLHNIAMDMKEEDVIVVGDNFETDEIAPVTAMSILQNTEDYYWRDKILSDFFGFEQTVLQVN